MAEGSEGCAVFSKGRRKWCAELVFSAQQLAARSYPRFATFSLIVWPDRHVEPTQSPRVPALNIIPSAVETSRVLMVG